MGDTEGGMPNIPEPSRGEIRIDPSRSSFQVTDAVICQVRQVIEGRRRRVVEAAQEQLRIVPSATIGDGRMNMANPAEREWLRRTADGLQEESLDIHGRQSNFHYSRLERWMAEGVNDHYSIYHFQRMRGVQPPNLEGSLRVEYQNLIPYANLFPWLPGAPAFNAMLPRSFSESEKAYVLNNYSKDDPIRLPWTVVERASEAEVQRIRVHREYDGNAAALTLVWRRAHGQAVVWMVKGEGGWWYKVTNMAFHPDFRPHFLRMARGLRHNAFLRVEGQTLHPQFRRFTVTMAECLERGDMLRLLRADLDQTEGNLFLTFFPHEGYWPDGIKFPWMLEMGIRQRRVGMPPEEARVFQELEDLAGQVASQSGLPYQTRQIDVSEIEKSAVLFWGYRNGGFMRAYYREPAGHDYPKREYPGINLHRNVVILDTILSAVSPTNQILREILGPRAVEIDHADLIDFVEWHEGTHGTGSRPDTPTQSSRRMSEVYGNFWGALVEPLADAGSVVALGRRHARGVISDEQLRSRIQGILGQQFRRYLSKAAASDLETMGNPDAAHLIGSVMMIGWLLRERVIQIQPDRRTVLFNEREFVPSVTRFHAELTRFSLRDDLPGFQVFVQGLTAEIPNDFDQRCAALKSAAGRPFVVNRNPGGIR